MSELSSSVQKELLKFRYLMHPSRLLIMKLLYIELMLPISDIRNAMNVTAGDLNSHTRSLKERGYIDIKDEFSSKGSIIHIAYITEKGKIEFKALFDLLKDFITTGGPLELLFSDMNIKTT